MEERNYLWNIVFIPKISYHDSSIGYVDELQKLYNMATSCVN